MRYIPGQSLSLVSCDGVASRVGNCPCVRYRRNCQLMASSMSVASRMPRSLWRVCCARHSQTGPHPDPRG